MTDATLRLGLRAITSPFTTFGAHWIDYDNDGYPDLFLANGTVRIVASQSGSGSPYRQNNALLHNDAGHGFHQDNQVAAAFSKAAVGRGAAFGDLDNEGDR